MQLQGHDVVHGRSACARSPLWRQVFEGLSGHAAVQASPRAAQCSLQLAPCVSTSAVHEENGVV